MNNPVYIGLFLTAEAREQAKAVFGTLLDNQYAHHCTLVFMPTEEEINALLPFLGEEFDLPVIGMAQDNNCQALVVSVPKLISKNTCPHVTVACAEGIKPFYSNELLEGGYTKISPFTLKVRLGYFNGEKDCFT